MHYYNYVIIIISPHLNFIAPQNFSIHGGSYIVAAVCAADLVCLREA